MRSVLCTWSRRWRHSHCMWTIIINVLETISQLSAIDSCFYHNPTGQHLFFHKCSKSIWSRMHPTSTTTRGQLLGATESHDGGSQFPRTVSASHMLTQWLALTPPHSPEVVGSRYEHQPHFLAGKQSLKLLNSIVRPAKWISLDYGQMISDYSSFCSLWLGNACVCV